MEDQSLIDNFFSTGQNARQLAVSNAEANPDNAARAINLGEATGTHPSIVDADLDSFEQNTRRQMTGSIVEGNEYIQDYVNSHPMASRVSNDDYHILDDVSQRAGRFALSFLQAPRGVNFSTWIRDTADIAREAAQGLVQPQPVDPAMRETIRMRLLEAGATERLADQQTEQVVKNFHRQEELTNLLNAPMILLSPILGAVRTFVSRPIEEGTEFPMQATEQYFMVAAAALGLRGIGKEFARQERAQTAERGRAQGDMLRERMGLIPPEVQEAAQAAQPFLRNGQEPPFGINPLIDEIKAKRTEVGLDHLDELLGAAQESSTRERSPQMFADFTRQQLPGEISIPFEAVAELYKNKPPAIDDGLLGWSPNFIDQFVSAAVTGGDIRIPMADWLARVDPATARELHDNIRIERSLPTIEEVKALSAAQDIDVFHGSPHSFDAFSMEHIGTGEGAQSYGHGLYFAENRNVAENYQNLARRNASWTMPDNSFMEIPRGNMYRARIRANPEEFLDWDKPFQEQSPRVQERLRAMGVLPDIASGMEVYVGLGTPLRARGAGRGADELVSKELREAGIPGIRYLDQGSRPGKYKVEEIKGPNGEDTFVIRGTPNTFSEYFNSRQEAEARVNELTPKTYNYVLFDDSLIEILDRNGEAINAVRQQAGLRPLADVMAAMEGEVRYYGAGTKATVKPTELLTRYEYAINNEIDKILTRIAPGARRQQSSRLEHEGRQVQGTYINYTDRAPLIIWSLEANSPTSTARHEAIHYLRREGFFTPDEWSILKTAAVNEDWMGKHRIHERYPDASAAVRIEEAIAEQYSKVWAKNPENVSTAIRTIFEKLKMALVLIKEALERAIGHTPTVDELFSRVESGEIGSREGAKPIDPRSFQGETAEQRLPAQGELDVTRQEDKKIFERAAAMGMTEPQYRRYIEKIKQQSVEDAEYIRKKALAAEQKRQTREWKENEARIRDEVETDLNNRPDISAVNYFRYGKLYGEDTNTRPRLNEDLLTKEQKAQLPEHWYGKNGIHPDDAANLFGYPDAQNMIDRLQAYESQRGEMGPGKFFDQLVTAETERRMQEQYGELSANIHSAAEDHVLGTSQMDLLHEETLAMGMLAGDEISFTKADVQGWVERRFAEARADKVDTVRILNEAGKAGRLAELSLLKENFKEAFKYKQQQYFAVAMAREAKKFEKERDRFERLVKRYSRREVTGVDQTAVDAIQSLLLEAGMNVRRTPEEVKLGLERAGHDSVQAYVTSTFNDGWEPSVQPWVLEGQLRQRASSLSVEDMRDFSAALQSLQHIGREVNKINIAGEKADFDAFKLDVISNINTLPMRTAPESRGWMGKLGHLLWGWDAIQTRMEEIVKDLDLRREGGPLFNSIIRPMAAAKHNEYTMLEQLSKRLQTIRGGNRAWRKTLDDTIPQDFLIDPTLGVPFDLTRENMINIMLHMGTESNQKKFVLGYFGKKDAVNGLTKLQDLFDRHATKEDWEFVQNMWDIFETWRPQADSMYYELSGVPPKWLDALEVNTPHGKFRGGYWPIDYNEWRSDVNAIRAKNAVNDGVFENYFRSTPGNAYTKERTGYVDYVDFQGSIEKAAARMQQMVHDIAYRRQIMDVNKIIKDKDIRKAIRQHYGEEYEAQLTPWLKKIASHFQLDESAIKPLNDFLRRVRYNLIGHTLPFNLRVLLSPDIATANPVTWASTAWNMREATELAYKHSMEIPHTFRNMDRDFRERLEHLTATKGLNSWTNDAVRLGFLPVVKLSQGLRISTFVSEFNAAKARGMDDKAAGAHADSIVRERHGSGGLPDLPAIMTSNEAVKTYTVFGGFFNTMYNWQRQIPGNIRRGEYKQAIINAWGAVILPSAFGVLLFNQVRESDSWWKSIAKAIVLQPLSTMVLARDIGNYFIEGFSPRSPWASVLQAIKTSSTELQRLIRSEPMKAPIKNFGNVIGLITGLPLAQISRTTQFLVDVHTGKQRPRNIWEYLRGIIQGEARLKP